MKTIIHILLFSTITAISNNLSADDITDKALRIYYQGNRHQALKIFYDIYYNDNNNAEALYEIAVANFEDNRISGEDFIAQTEKAAESAFTVKDDALAHYILSQAANKTENQDLALEEIDKALEIEPTSARYLRGKMLFLAAKAKKLKNNELFLQALDVANKGIAAVDTDPRKYFTKGGFHFEIARWVHGCCSPYREAIIDHYKTAIELNDITQTYVSYAWNNMSYQLHELGRCEEAKEAAENALKIAVYGNALQNLEYAKTCLAENNIFYKIQYIIESLIKLLLRFFR